MPPEPTRIAAGARPRPGRGRGPKSGSTCASKGRLADKAAQSAVAERLHWLLSALLPSALCALDVRAARASDASVKALANAVLTTACLLSMPVPLLKTLLEIDWARLLDAYHRDALRDVRSLSREDSGGSAAWADRPLDPRLLRPVLSLLRRSAQGAPRLPAPLRAPTSSGSDDLEALCMLEGVRPLHAAAMAGHAAACELLLSTHAVDAWARTASGETAAQLAPRDAPMVRALLSRRAGGDRWRGALAWVVTCWLTLVAFLVLWTGPRLDGVSAHRTPAARPLLAAHVRRARRRRRAAAVALVRDLLAALRDEAADADAHARLAAALAQFEAARAEADGGRAAQGRLGVKAASLLPAASSDDCFSSIKASLVPPLSSALKDPALLASAGASGTILSPTSTLVDQDVFWRTHSDVSAATLESSESDIVSRAGSTEGGAAVQHPPRGSARALVLEGSTAESALAVAERSSLRARALAALEIDAATGIPALLFVPGAAQERTSRVPPDCIVAAVERAAIQSACALDAIELALHLEAEGGCVALAEEALEASREAGDVASSPQLAGAALRWLWCLACRRPASPALLWRVHEALEAWKACTADAGVTDVANGIVETSADGHAADWRGLAGVAAGHLEAWSRTVAADAALRRAVRASSLLGADEDSLEASPPRPEAIEPTCSQAAERRLTRWLTGLREAVAEHGAQASVGAVSTARARLAQLDAALKALAALADAVAAVQGLYVQEPASYRDAAELAAPKAAALDDLAAAIEAASDAPELQRDCRAAHRLLLAHRLDVRVAAVRARISAALSSKQTDAQLAAFAGECGASVEAALADCAPGEKTAKCLVSDMALSAPAFRMATLLQEAVATLCRADGDARQLASRQEVFGVLEDAESVLGGAGVADGPLASRALATLSKAVACAWETLLAPVGTDAKADARGGAAPPALGASSALAPTSVCVFFQSGYCQAGTQCAHSHDLDAGPWTGLSRLSPFPAAPSPAPPLGRTTSFPPRMPASFAFGAPGSEAFCADLAALPARPRLDALSAEPAPSAAAALPARGEPGEASVEDLSLLESMLPDFLCLKRDASQ
ncbi:hypothetical protein QBZ16_002067 [Prototheca wickerhamii]|uniref:C3H1-type domain-containing protein n=1 Tax=Prototheca wickerhamii TaxID=3111 RepID=A0AAD9ING0_PROWI|nr:hypothetical protein QBZ16_002067 [Prototheca wickerhamii]